MEITYHQEGAYLIPDLKLSDTTEYHIGKYGRMRKRFLEENHRGIYSYMLCRKLYGSTLRRLMKNPMR